MSVDRVVTTQLNKLYQHILVRENFKRKKIDFSKKKKIV